MSGLEEGAGNTGITMLKGSKKLMLRKESYGNKLGDHIIHSGFVIAKAATLYSIFYTVNKIFQQNDFQSKSPIMYFSMFINVHKCT